MYKSHRKYITLFLFMPYLVFCQIKVENSVVIHPISNGCNNITIRENNIELHPKILIGSNVYYLYDLGVQKKGVFHYCHYSKDEAKLVFKSDIKKIEFSIDVSVDKSAIAEILSTELLEFKNYLSKNNFTNIEKIIATEVILDKAIESSSIFKEIGHFERAAETMFLAAKIADKVLGGKKAIVYYEKSNMFWEQTSNFRMHAILKNDWGRSYNYLGEYDNERKQLLASKKIAKNNNLTWLEIVVWNNICLNLHDDGNLRDAYICYNDVLVIAKEYNDSKRIAVIQNNLGGYHSEVGNTLQAIKSFEQAKINYEYINDIGGARVATINIANEFIYLGKFEESINLLVNSENDFNKLILNPGDYSRNYRKEIAWAKYLIGKAFLKTGDYLSAHSYLENSLSLLTNTNHKATNLKLWLSVNYGLFELFKNTKAFDDANNILLTIDKVLTLLPDSNKNKSFNFAKYNLAISDLYFLQKMYLKSKNHAQIAVEIARNLEYPYLSAKSEIFLGKSLLYEDDNQAESRILNSIQSIESINPLLSADTYMYLSEFYYANDNLNKAEFYKNKVLKQILKVNNMTTDFNLKLSLLSSWNNLTSIETKIALKKNEDSDVLAINSLMINSRFSSMKLRNSDNFVHSHELAGINKKINIKINAKLTHLENDPSSPLINILNNDILVLESQLKALQVSESFKTNLPKKINEINSKELFKIIGNDQTLLKFWLGKDVSYLWLVSQNQIKLIYLGGKKEIENSILLAINSINQKNSKNLNTILEKVATILRLNEWQSLILTKRLLIEADSVLELLPFDALPINKHEVMLDKYSISMIRSIFLYNGDKIDFLNNELAVFADSITNMNDNRLIGINHKIEVNSSRFLNLPRLKGSLSEAIVIGDIFPKITSQYIGFNSNKKNLLNAIQNKSIIHIASHAINNIITPNSSAIVLSRVNRLNEQIDSIVKFNNILNIKNELNLVVLSACSTSLGKVIPDHGVFGLPRAFLESGSKNVISTLWPIDDRATTLFMQKFYQYLSDKSNTIATALTNTKRDLKHSRKYYLPYYWSGFVLNK